MAVEYFERRKIPSFGECIYCGRSADAVELNNEHVIPFSLGGNVEIVDGSCKMCAAETAKTEEHIGRKVLWDFRIHTNMQTRRPKDRPSVLPVRVAIKGGPLQTMELPVSDHPFFTPMPVWGLPGLLTGAPPSAAFPAEKAHVYYHLPPNIRQTLDLGHLEVAELPFPEFPIDSHKFARAIAKIGYCQAVVNYGLHNFRRLVLPDLILGKYPFVPYFVGCALDDPPPPRTDKVAHVIDLSTVAIGRLQLILASVRLFANSGTAQNGTPIYRVVVGAPKHP